MADLQTHTHIGSKQVYDRTGLMISAWDFKTERNKQLLKHFFITISNHEDTIGYKKSIQLSAILFSFYPEVSERQS